VWMRSYIRKFRKSISLRGITGTCAIVVLELVNYFANMSPARIRKLAARKERESEFDKKFGINTGGCIPLSDLDVDNDNWIYGTRYQAIYPLDFGEVLDPFNLQYKDFTFVDVGSGKGRAIIIASALPFKKIIGIEFSGELHEVALANLDHCFGSGMRREDIELYCMDAIDFQLPAEPLVLYLYNPFSDPVMTMFVENVVISLRKHPRRILVLYFSPSYSDSWDEANLFYKKHSTDLLCIYDTQEFIEQQIDLVT